MNKKIIVIFLSACLFFYLAFLCAQICETYPIYSDLSQMTKELYNQSRLYSMLTMVFISLGVSSGIIGLSFCYKNNEHHLLGENKK